MIPGSLIGPFLILQSFHTILIGGGIRKAVLSPSINHHVPIQPCLIQGFLKIGNVFGREERICLSVGNQNFG